MISFDITDRDAFRTMGIIEALRTVVDPELNVNIIDLGLVYNAEVNEIGKKIIITMTLSSPHCPMGDAIVQSVENCIEHHYNEYTAEVKLSWEPKWNYEMITEEGLRQLNG